MVARKPVDLAGIIDAYVELNEQIEDLKEEQKALADRAYVNGMVKAGSEANARKVVAQLAKEMAWEDEQRASQQQMELALDQGRVTLGITMDTPLEAEIERLRDDKTVVDVRFAQTANRRRSGSGGETPPTAASVN